MESITQEKKKLRSVVCLFVTDILWDNLDGGNRYHSRLKRPLDIRSSPREIHISQQHARNSVGKMG
jgi:hypothetical protein